MKAGWVSMPQCFRNRRHVLTLGIACTLIGAMIAIPWIFWGWLSGGESGSTTIRNIALVAAGPIALALALWRSLVADRQAKTAQQVLSNERYQKGAEMLGSEVLSVRLGGIYALQCLAEEHPEKYHVQIMRLFCAFVRLPTRDQSLETGQVEIEPGTLLGIRQDVEAVMEAINARSDSRVGLERKAGFRLDLRGAELPGAQLLNADFSNAFFHHANLSGSDVADTNLSDAFLSYADLSGAIFSNVSCTRAHLVSANLSGALLQDLDLSRVSFHYANLSRANLHKADLSDAIFQDASLTNAWLDSADLSSASFLRADLSGAKLMGADLTDAHFLDAKLNNANFSDAKLSGVKFSNGGIQAAKGLRQTQIDMACADPSNPPKLTGVLDPENNLKLIWRGKDCYAKALLRSA